MKTLKDRTMEALSAKFGDELTNHGVRLGGLNQPTETGYQLPDLINKALSGVDLVADVALPGSRLALLRDRLDDEEFHARSADAVGAAVKKVLVDDAQHMVAVEAQRGEDFAQQWALVEVVAYAVTILCAGVMLAAEVT